MEVFWGKIMVIKSLLFICEKEENGGGRPSSCAYKRGRVEQALIGMEP